MATYKADKMLRPVAGGLRNTPTLLLRPLVASTAVKVPLTASNPVFSILHGVEAGQRLLPVLELHTLRKFEATKTSRILTGRGAMPLTETQTTTETKPIRRWPRDWHGENM